MRARRLPVLLVLVLVLAGVSPAGATVPVAPGDVVMASHTTLSVGTAGVGSAGPGGMSADGEWILFGSSVTNLVAGQTDTNNGADLFLYQRSTGATTLVSHTPGSTTTTGNGTTSSASISADGAYVVFESFATNLVSGEVDDTGNRAVYLYQRSTGTISFVSHVSGSAVTITNGVSYNGAITPDGAYVTFSSIGTNLVSGQGMTADYNTYLYAQATGSVTLVSHVPGSPAAPANSYAFANAISADSNWVLFGSKSTNLVSGQVDTNTKGDVFLYDRSTGAVTLVSHTPTSAVTAVNGASGGLSVSKDGSYVLFSSDAPNASGGQSGTNPQGDFFLYSRATGGVTLVTHASGSTTTVANASPDTARMTPDAKYVVYSTQATNVVPGETDDNNNPDIFRYDTSSGAASIVSHGPGSTTATSNGYSETPTVSDDGSVIAFYSTATNLVTGPTGTHYQAYVTTLPGGSFQLVSHTPGSPTTEGNDASTNPLVSADGNVVAFPSVATNLVPGQSDANGATDAFVWSRGGDVARRPTDFDGDGRSDVAVYRPSSGVWYAGGASPSSVQFGGVSGDIPVPGDYDGDGNVDQAVFRPSTGVWYLNTSPPQAIPFGTSTDIPVPADYDGDGKTDLAVFRPSTGVWYIRTASPQAVAFGANGDIPVPGDYDGDGKADLAVYRPSTGVWYISGPHGSSPQFGASGDIPVPADYDGDGHTDIAVYRPSTGVWYLRTATPQSIVFGASGDRPQPADYDGDGRADIAVFRPSNSVWYVRSPASSNAFGASGDVPLALPNAISRFFS